MKHTIRIGAIAIVLLLVIVAVVVHGTSPLALVPISFALLYEISRTGKL